MQGSGYPRILKSVNWVRSVRRIEEPRWHYFRYQNVPDVRGRKPGLGQHPSQAIVSCRYFLSLIMFVLVPLCDVPSQEKCDRVSILPTANVHVCALSISLNSSSN